MRTTLVTMLLAMCLLPAAAHAAEGNLLPDPSFEQAAGPWKQRAWSGDANARWTVDSPGRTGRQCLSIASDRGSDAAWTAVVAIRPNTFYRLSGWVKTRDIRGAAGALLNIQNMQHVRTPAATGTRDWTRISTIFFSDKVERVEINCLFGGWGQSTGQAWFDDVVLEPIGGLEGNAQAVVVIDPSAPLLARSPMLFGGFIEHFHRQIYGGIFEPGSPLSDAEGFRTDVIAAMKELKLSVVRWPGGCFASGYHWKDGVGKERRPTYDLAWGVEDPNTFGTDEFVAWCRRVGCEPYICTNAGNGTVQEMREWVEYCRQNRLGVRYWSIGNENWGGHEIGAKTPQEWGPLVHSAAREMSAADRGLVLLAAATPNRNWTLPLLKAAGSELNLVAIHEYWLPCWGDNLTPEYLACIMHSEGPERTIQRVISLLDESGHRGKIRIAFDEWNLRGWHHPGFPRKQKSDNADPAVIDLIRRRDLNDEASQYTMADALFSASFFNACLRHADDVGMANIAPIVNTRGPLYVHPKGMVKRTTFHVLWMYANLLGDRVALAEMASPALTHAGRSVATLDAIATRIGDGSSWRIALANRHPAESLNCVVQLGGKPLDGVHQATILDGDSPEAFNDIARPGRVAPRKAVLSFKAGRCALPPHSVTVLEVDR